MKTLTRREFVIDGASITLAGCATGPAAFAGPRLRFGVVSDIHITTEAFLCDEHNRICLSTAALSKFPNAVAFSGHAHQPLSDERGFWLMAKGEP